MDPGVVAKSPIRLPSSTPCRVHQPRSLLPIGDPPAGNSAILAILFCFGFFLLVFTGGGRYSIDALRGTAEG